MENRPGSLFFSNMLFSVAMLANSCERHEELARMQILISTSWSMTEYGCSIIDDEEYCIVKFNSNGTFESSGDLPGYNSWYLADNDETLVLNSDRYKIITISENELRIKWKDAIFVCPLSFIPAPPFKATTIGVSDLTMTSATLIGAIRTSVQPATVAFEYGSNASYGQTVTVTNNIIPGLTSNIVDVSILNLTPATEYHYRIKTSNSEETFYGQDLTFRTLNAVTVSDIDGNEYTTITNGSKVWMAENLEVTKFNDGEPITLITDGTAWGESDTPAYCWYDNDEAKYKDKYGALYNWFAVSNGKLCPAGWHCAQYPGWNDLLNSLGRMPEEAEEAGTDHWVFFDKVPPMKVDFPFCRAAGEQIMTHSPGPETLPICGAAPKTTLCAPGILTCPRLLSTSIMVKEYGCSVRCIKN